MDYILTVKDLAFSYGGKKVIEGVSFSVKWGQIVTILGPNGGGKTSLVRILVGIYKNYVGEINYTGKSVIGYLPQSFKVNRLMPMTVEYFLMNTCFDKIGMSSLHDAIEHVDIRRLLRRQVSELSAGEMQLVLLVRCLMINPDLIVLDEPVSCMDVDAKDNFYNLIGRLVTARRISVVMTSHDLHCVMDCSDKVICINHSVFCEGTPAEIAESAKFLSVFPNNV